MSFYKITFTDEGETDSMVFAAGSEKDAFRQLTDLCGDVPRNKCQIKPIKAEEYYEESGTEPPVAADR